MDEEAWFEVTPENVGRYISKRVPTAFTIIDGCSGVGGNAIQFARDHDKVTGLEISRERISMARRNAGVYGVSGRIEFVAIDVLQYLQELPMLKNTCFYCSPPWGGMKCYESERVRLHELPLNMEPIISEALKKCGRAILHLPRNLDVEDLAECLGAFGVKYFEIERVFYDNGESRVKYLLVFISKDDDDSIFRIVSEFRQDSASNLLGASRSASILATALVRVTYLGRHCLSALREFGLQGVTVSPLADRDIILQRIHSRR